MFRPFFGAAALATAGATALLPTHPLAAGLLLAAGAGAAAAATRATPGERAPQPAMIPLPRRR